MQDGLFRAPVAVALAAILSAGCAADSTSTDETESIPVTALGIDPVAFLGDVPCSSKLGALQSYVVTLTDDTSQATLPSTEPIPCSRAARFRYILAKHQYTAEVDAYDVPAEELVPSGATAGSGSGPEGLPSSGSRHMLVKATKTPITPRWTTKCNQVTSASQTTTLFNTCSPLTDTGSPAPTSIEVDPKAAFGELRCVKDGGEIASLDITPADGSLAPLVGLECGAGAVVFNAGIVPGQVYSFRVEARAEAGGEVRWGASCFAVAEEALQTRAACDPLSSTGSIEVDAAALAEAGIACGGDVKAFQATIEPLGVSSGPVACGQGARFLAIEPGTYDVILQGVGPNGPEEAGVTCGAVVTPGATSKVTCMKAP